MSNFAYFRRERCFSRSFRESIVRGGGKNEQLWAIISSTRISEISWLYFGLLFFFNGMQLLERLFGPI